MTLFFFKVTPLSTCFLYRPALGLFNFLPALLCKVSINLWIPCILQSALKRIISHRKCSKDTQMQLVLKLHRLPSTIPNSLLANHKRQLKQDGRNKSVCVFECVCVCESGSFCGWDKRTVSVQCSDWKTEEKFSIIIALLVIFTILKLRDALYGSFFP